MPHHNGVRSRQEARHDPYARPSPRSRADVGDRDPRPDRPRPGRRPVLRDHLGVAAEGRAPPLAPGAELTAVRAGRHDCYDRLVLDVRGITPRRVLARGVRADRSGGSDGPARSLSAAARSCRSSSAPDHSGLPRPASTERRGERRGLPHVPAGRLRPGSLRGRDQRRASASGRGCRSASSPCPGPAHTASASWSTSRTLVTRPRRPAGSAPARGCPAGRRRARRLDGAGGAAQGVEQLAARSPAEGDVEQLRRGVGDLLDPVGGVEARAGPA